MYGDSGRPWDAWAGKASLARMPDVGPGAIPPGTYVDDGRVQPLFEDGIVCDKPVFALAVSHCPWLPDRARNMEELRATLVQPGMLYREITDRAPNHVWSQIMWLWGIAQAATHIVFMQDDLKVPPEFWAILSAMVRAVPNRVLSLISNHPMSERAHAEGHVWFRMCETLGSAYVFPIALLGVFLDWRARLPTRDSTSINEDFLITRWQYTTGRRSWCPVPSLVQTRDDEIESTNPREGRYLFRQSYIDWTDPRVAGAALTSVEHWTPKTLPPDYGPVVAYDCRVPGHGPFTEIEVAEAHHQLALKRARERAAQAPAPTGRVPAR